jgi:hypothetical protein
MPRRLPVAIKRNVPSNPWMLLLCIKKYANPRAINIMANVAMKGGIFP